jgi:hypothetical protein
VEEGAVILLKEFYRIAAPGGPVSPFIGSELQKERGIVENESKTGDLFLEDMPLLPRKERLLLKRRYYRRTL